MTNARTPQHNDIDDDRLGRTIGISVALHVLAFILFAVRAVLYPTEPLTLENSIRVDMVALPDKQAALPPMPVEVPAPVAETKPPEPEPEKPKPAEPPKPEVAKPAPPKPETPKVNLNKTKADQQSALKRLEALDKIERMSKESANRTKVAPAPQPVKGNAVSAGNALRGVARMEHQGYLQTIDGAIKGQWNLPGWMRNANLSARVRLYVDAKGLVVKRDITKSSGNEVYDARVLAAIDATSPLPAPPNSLVNILAVDGIELEFVPE